MKPSVYLAGPIAGLTIAEARKWRTEVIETLDFLGGIRGIDPLAGADLKADEVQSKQAPELDPFTSAKGILCQDFRWCTTSDMVLVNFLYAEKVSIGSVMECAWAYQARIPLVIVGASVTRILGPVEERGIHDHTLLRSIADYWVDDLATAVDIVVKVIGR